MDVVVPTSSFPRDANDWRGRFVLDLSRALVGRGHRLIHVVPDPTGRNERQEIEADLLVQRVSFGPRFARGLVAGQGIGANLRAKPWRIAGLPGLLRALRNGLFRELDAHPDAVILSHWVLPAGLAASRVARERPGTRQVCVVHGGALQNLLSWPGGNRILRDWARDCAAALYVSEDLRRRARMRLAGLAPPDEVSPMGVVPERFGPLRSLDEARELLGLDPKAFVVMGLGRLLPLKGFDLLLRAAAGLPGLKLVIAGEGPEATRLGRLAKTLSVDLDLTGKLTPPEIGLLMDAADLLVVPSRLGPGGRSEGSPLVALEALARGLAVYGSRSGGLPELLAGRPDCRIFRVDDREALAELLHDAAGDVEGLRGSRDSTISESAPWDYTRISRIVEDLLIGGGGRS